METTNDTTNTTTYGRRVRLSEVAAGDILLVNPDQPADPVNNTVEAIDGAVGTLCIIDFTNKTSTAPITTNPWCWVAR